MFKNKTVVITGGTTGIGLAAAQLFVRENANVVITGHSKKNLDAAQTIIKGEVFAVQGDVTKLADLDQLFETINQTYGKVDVLFANAGVAERIPVGDVTEKAFDTMVNANYKGAYFTVQKAVPYLNKGASVILNASIAAIRAIDNHSVYSSSKAALIQLARSFALDLVSQDIRVNAVSPGYIKTPIWDNFWDTDPDRYEALCKTVPLQKRFGTPEEIASVVLFLASDAARYITAQNIVIDGGLTARMA